ncbi:MAG: hypothetical protein H7A41_01145 [Chlamydiales bacterium]|nr:hypothetical protein [Chlamydiales bacterium]
MKKNSIKLWIIGIFFLLLLCSTKAKAIEVLPEIKAAYFHPTDNRFREIYSGAGIYSIETSVEAWEGLYPWMSLGFFRQTGRSLEDRFSTHITLVPIGIGLKYLLELDKIVPYVGLGMQVTYTRMHDHSPYVDRKFAKWGIGGLAKIGSYLYFTDNFFFDVFCDYSYLKVNYHHPKKKVINLRADLSSLQFGGGFGYRF